MAGAGLTVVVILTLLLTLLLTTRGRTSTAILDGATEQTATASSAQATATAEGTPFANPTGTAAPHGTATPRPLAPAVHIVGNTGDGSGVDAMCPSGELALTGGWSGGPSAPINFIGRSVGNGWRAHSFVLSVRLDAFVLCLQHGAGATITERFASVSAAVGAAGTGVAVCHAGEVPLGGGFNIPGGDIVSLGPTADHSSYRLTLANHTTTQGGSVSVDCLRAPGAHLTVPPPAQTLIAAGAVNDVQVSCPKGTLLSGGGIDLLNGSAVATEFTPISATTWYAVVQNHTIVSTTVRLYALCLAFS